MSFQTSWSPEEVTSGRPRPGRQSLLNISLWCWGRYLSGCFSDWFTSQLGLCSLLGTDSGPTRCGVEREGLSAVPGNWGQLWTWDSFLRERVWSSP